MNSVILTGRLTKDPETTNGNNGMYTRFALAVDRKFSKDGSTDFIRCVAFGKTAEFISKYFSKGAKVGVEGRIQTGSYDGNDGKKVYTTDVVCESVEFEESKRSNSSGQAPSTNDGFVAVPDGIEEEVPFE